MLMKTYEEVIAEGSELPKHFKTNFFLTLSKQLKNDKHYEVHPIP